MVLEALSCGRPVVASRVGDVPKLVGKENGILVEPGNSHALFEALKIVVERKWEQGEICKSVSGLSWDVAASQYYSVLYEAYSNSRFV